MSKTIPAIDKFTQVRMMVQMTLTGRPVRSCRPPMSRGCKGRRSHRPDAVATDQDMPRPDGSGFIRKFRQTAPSAGAPVVFISTEGNPATSQNGRWLRLRPPLARG